MAFLAYQRQRLAYEQMLLKREMPDFSFHELITATNVRGFWTSNGGRVYKIRIDIPAGYPDECPSTYITDPQPLLDAWGRALTTLGSSHNMHIWATDRPGVVKLCTFRPEYWDATNTIIQLLHKAFLWIMAYEAHLETRRMIDDYLLTMAR